MECSYCLSGQPVFAGAYNVVGVHRVFAPAAVPAGVHVVLMCTMELMMHSSRCVSFVFWITYCLDCVGWLGLHVQAHAAA
eukprot:1158103-Pelagomonas_calceolata.AAC.4